MLERQDKVGHAGQGVGACPGGLALVKAPAGNGLIPGRHSRDRGQWAQRALAIRAQDQAAGVKGRVNKLLAGVGDILRRAAHRQRLRHLIQMAGALLAVAGDPRLIAHPRRQVTNQQAHRQHHGEGQHVLHIRYRQGTAWGDEKEIEADHVDYRRQDRGPAAIKQRHDHHPKQVDHHQIGGIKVG